MLYINCEKVSNYNYAFFRNSRQQKIQQKQQNRTNIRKSVATAKKPDSRAPSKKDDKRPTKKDDTSKVYLA